MNGTNTAPEIVEAAAQWSMVLDSDDVRPADRAACEAWCERDPLHRQVLERMRAFGAALDSLGEPGRRTVARMSREKSRRSSRQRNAILGLCAISLAGWWASQSFTARELWPDYRTARGELRTITLADGSTLVLDTDSAISVSSRENRRTITLHRGRVFAKVAPDKRRPFVVSTRDGTAIALGTAYSVTRSDSGTEVRVTESRVEVCGRRRVDCILLTAGGRARIDTHGVTRLKPADDSHVSWTAGWLEVDDRPLPEVLSELNRYSPRPIRFDATALAELRITGSYPLTDPLRAIEAIALHSGLNVRELPDGTLMLTPSR
jgi:transmembrane sensor